MNPKLYKLEQGMYLKYIEHAKHGATASIEVIERKLSAIINNCPKHEVYSNDKKVKHFFKDFYLFTNEDENIIFWLDWIADYDYHTKHLSKELLNNLKRDYIYFGLSGLGNSFSKNTLK